MFGIYCLILSCRSQLISEYRPGSSSGQELHLFPWHIYTNDSGMQIWVSIHIFIKAHTYRHKVSPLLNKCTTEIYVNAVCGLSYQLHPKPWIVYRGWQIEFIPLLSGIALTMFLQIVCSIYNLGWAWQSVHLQNLAHPTLWMLHTIHKNIVRAIPDNRKINSKWHPVYTFVTLYPLLNSLDER